MHRIGIDLGGTKIESIVLDSSGTEIFRKRVPTQQEKGPSGILHNISSLYQDCLTAIQGAPATLGIGTPGAISQKTGLLKNSNTICLNGRPFQKELEDCLKRPVKLENDANCFALAESILGAGRGKDVVFGVIMGTGCGGGLVINGKVREGLQGIAGEWGHMTLDPAGPECYCGHRGCVETLISGGGLERLYENQFGVKKTLQEISEMFKIQDSTATRFMSFFLKHFGRALANLINILDPDMIVLGGGVSNLQALYSSGIEEVRKAVFNDELKTPIVRNQLGDSAGVLGAALIGIAP